MTVDALKAVLDHHATFVPASIIEASSSPWSYQVGSEPEALSVTPGDTAMGHSRRPGPESLWGPQPE